MNYKLYKDTVAAIHHCAAKVQAALDSDTEITARLDLIQTWRLLLARFECGVSMEQDGRFWVQTQSPNGTWVYSVGCPSYTDAVGRKAAYQRQGEDARIVTKTLTIIGD